MIIKGKKKISKKSLLFLYRTKNNKTYAELVYGVHIRRRPLYYIFNVIIPCAMLSCLTCMSFWYENLIRFCCFFFCIKMF